MSWLYDIVVQSSGGRVLATSDQALDSAAGFQEGFRVYLPLYNDYTGLPLSLLADIQRPYDELREIDFARLAEAAERVATAGDSVERQRGDLEARMTTVREWTGVAADAFRDHIQQLDAAVWTVQHDLGAIATATGHAVPAAQQVICEYVVAVGDIDFCGFDDPGDIAFMIEVERLLKPAGDVVRAVLDWLGDLIGVALPLPGGGGFGPLGAVTDFVVDRFGDAVDVILDTLGMSGDAFLGWIAGLVREYLDASFRMPFETNLALLHGAVDAARTGVQAAFAPIVQAATAVTDNPFGQLPSPPHGGPCPEAGAGVSTLPAGMPAAGGGSGGAPAGDSSAGGGSGAGPSSGGPGPAADPPAADTLTVAAGELTITGQVSQSPGALLVTVTDADGDSTSYELRVDQNGSPQLVAVGANWPVVEADLPPATAAAGLASAGSPGVPATGPVGGAGTGGDPSDGMVRTGSVSGGPVPGGQSGVILGDPGFGQAAQLDGGAALSGHIGTATGSGAQLASVVDAAGPGPAQLASVADGAAPAGAGHGVPMMPLGGAVAGGTDDERRGGAWQVPATEVFDTDQEPVVIGAVIGEDR